MPHLEFLLQEIQQSYEIQLSGPEYRPTNLSSSSTTLQDPIEEQAYTIRYVQCSKEVIEHIMAWHGTAWYDILLFDPVSQKVLSAPRSAVSVPYIVITVLNRFRFSIPSSCPTIVDISLLLFFPNTRSYALSLSSSLNKETGVRRYLALNGRMECHSI